MATTRNRGEEGNKSADYSSITSQLRERVIPLMGQTKVPGLAIALIDGEKTVWADGYGYTDWSKSITVTADTLFSAQSISKTYTPWPPGRVDRD